MKRWDFDFAEFEAELWDEFRGSKVSLEEPATNDEREPGIVYPSDIIAWCRSRGVYGISVELDRGWVKIRPRRG